MSEEPHVHQLLHGYARGHRLLAFSTDVAGEVASLISTTSDAAPNYRPSSGDYLTGYGLPDGSWALARTWPALGADRPNTVWTHTLLVPASHIGRVSAWALADRLRKPDDIDDYSDYRAPIPIRDVTGRAATTSQDMAAAAVAAYLRTDVVLTAADRGDRESAALALWDQHWSPARRTLFFCTAPDVGVAHRPGQRVLRFTARETSEEPPSLPAIVADDLCRRTPFREWVHFVGSGERDTTHMATYAEAFLLLHEASPDARTIRRLEDLLASAGGTEQLRRLKRRMFSFDRGTPQWPVPPDVLLESLARGRLGELTTAEDASLHDWIGLAWRADPERVLEVLTAAQDREAVAASAKRTAAEAVATAFDDALVELLTPHSVEPAAGVVPHRVLPLLAQRDDEALWRSWAALPPAMRQATMAPFDAPADWTAAIRGVRDNADATKALLQLHPSAVTALTDDLASRPAAAQPPPFPIPDAAARIVAGEIAAVSQPRRIRALSHLASPAHLPRHADWASWRRALAKDRDPVTAAIAYLLGRRASSHAGIELAAVALGALYPLLARTEAPDVWSRIADRISGDRHSWDRCGRLVSDFSKTVARQDEKTAAKLVGLVNDQHHDAALALADALQRSKKSEPLWKAIANLVKW